MSLRDISKDWSSGREFTLVELAQAERPMDLAKIGLYLICVAAALEGETMPDAVQLLRRLISQSNCERELTKAIHEDWDLFRLSWSDIHPEKE